MFLNLDQVNGKFKLVFELATHLQEHPELIKMAQQVTLDKTRFGGLKGKYGFYGSDEWWENIRQGVIPSSTVTATVLEIGAAGFPEKNASKTSMYVQLSDGSHSGLTMVAHDKKDLSLFKVGCQVKVFYAHEELKNSVGLGGRSHKVLIEMAVSV